MKLPSSFSISKLLRRTVVLVALAGLALSSLVQVSSRPADALSDFDRELLTLINNHRSSLGLQPFVEHAPMSDAAVSWSSTMRNRSGAPCGSAGHQHASAATIQAGGLPTGWSSWGENIAFACGTPGFTAPIAWSYSRMPAQCRAARLDYTTPHMQFCQWIDSSTHRAAIENPRYTHIGVGSAFANGNGARSTFSTTRFATAPVAPAAPAVPTCDGKRATVELSKGQRPGNGPDVIVGTAGADVIDGLGGDDIICGFGGNDRIIGNNGNDTIFGGAGNDTIEGGEGWDKLYGEAGADTIRGGPRGDRIYGHAGNDNLSGDGGWDWIYGQDGFDTLNGGTGSDQLFGGNHDDRIFGDGGPDVINGEGGNDTIDAGKGADKASGGPGNDTITGFNGPDQLWGNDGNDVLRGGRSGDKLYGQNGSDSLFGEGGWDALDGGPSSDRCDGGFGRDTAGACEDVRQTP